MTPRQNLKTERAIPPQTLVVDHGAFTLKAGFARLPPSTDDCSVIPNCLAKARDNRIYVAAQVENCTDLGEMTFRRPVQKGYIVNWEAEREIWQKTFFEQDAKIKCDPHETSLLLAEAPNCPNVLQTNCDQIVFEEFEFAAYHRCVGSLLNAYNEISALVGDPPRSSVEQPAEAVMVVDSGYSHTTATPLLRGRPVQQAVRRLDLGGKFLTNYLKEILSIRQMDVREETHLIDQMKEDVCFVSTQFQNDLERTWTGGVGEKRKVDPSIVVDYVLPDYSHRLRGEQRPHDPAVIAMRNKLGAVAGPDGVKEYVISLGNERFAVPEILFNPGDIGLRQAGIPELVMQSMASIPQGLWAVMLSNILVVGGNANLPGFVERLFQDIRRLAPTDCMVRIAKAPDPIKSTWLGGARMASNRSVMKQLLVTRQEYQEHGSAWLLRRFAGTK